MLYNIPYREAISLLPCFMVNKPSSRASSRQVDAIKCITFKVAKYFLLTSIRAQMILRGGKFTRYFLHVVELDTVQ